MNDLSKNQKYDVSLRHVVGGITVADVMWSLRVDREQAHRAVLEILVQKETHPDEFQGDIIIQSCNEDYMPRYNGRECETDSSDNSRPLLRSVPSPGTDETDRLARALNRDYSVPTWDNHQEFRPDGTRWSEPDGLTQQEQFRNKEIGNAAHRLLEHMNKRPEVTRHWTKEQQELFAKHLMGWDDNV